MATYAIGDVQGCFDPLQRLVKKLNYQQGRDKLWFCGDLVNRGPESASVLRWIKAQGNSAVGVLGNHDLTLLAVSEGYVKAGRKDTFDDVLNAKDSKALLQWLRERPLIHHSKKLGYTMMHAGLPPQWDLKLALVCAAEVETALTGDGYRPFLKDMFGNQPSRWSEKLKGQDRLRFITNCCTRIRFCTADGEISLVDKGPPGTQGKGLVPWFEVPGRRSESLNIVFGHWASLGYYRAPGIAGLDSGCVWGEKLTALRLDKSADPISVSRNP